MVRRRSLLVGSAAALASGVFPASAAPAAAPRAVSAPGSSLTVVAHPDDDLLFVNPDIAADIDAGLRVRTVVVTAGDGSQGEDYWRSREDGLMAAYAAMTGVTNSWTTADAGIRGHPAVLRSLRRASNVSLVFLRLPDGMAGQGNPNNNFESLQELYEQSIQVIHAVDGSTSYTRSSLVTTLTSLMTSFGPDTIRTLDYFGSYGDGDHSDHYSVGYFTEQAQQDYAAAHTLLAYQGYGTQDRPQNVTGDDLSSKSAAWNEYVVYDSVPCGSPPRCGSGEFTTWLQRSYVLDNQSMTTQS